jgi:hypothetical protein
MTNPHQKITMVIAVALMVVMFPPKGSLAAEDDARKLLKRDLVIESGGRYVHEQTNVCRVLLPAALGGGFSDPFYTKRRVEAPSAIMGRDNFVAITTRYLLIQRIAFAHSFVQDISAIDATQAVKCSPVEKTPGLPDFVIDMSMDENGMSVEMLDTHSGKKSLDRHSWSEILTP